MSSAIRSILESSKGKVEPQEAAPKLNMPTLKLPKLSVSDDAAYGLKAVISDLISDSWTTATPEQKKQAQDRLEVVKKFWDGGYNYLVQTSYGPLEVGEEGQETPVAFLVKVTDHGAPAKQEAKTEAKTEAKDDPADAQIQAIFAKHNITPAKGMEGFWDAVDEVAEISAEDGDELERLADEWDEEAQAKFSAADGIAPADAAYEAAFDLRPAIEQMLDSIASICQAIEQELGSAMAPGLKAAVISALRNGAGDTSGSKFDLETAKARLARYYDEHEEE